MYLISVYFDEKTNKILSGYINKIAEKTGNTFMIDNAVPPHLTISAIETKNEDALRERFLNQKEVLASGQIQIVSIGQLLPYVMYGIPVLGEYLQGLSRSIYDSVVDIDETIVSKYYTPGSWLPHITLGKTLDKEQMQKAFFVMQDCFTPFTATVKSVGLSKVNPYRDIERFSL